MSAEVLRRAAALMRENAQKAEPGRWKTWGMSVLADPKGTSDLDDAIHVADMSTPSISSRRLHTGNVEHIASWHPAVALAVADWLDGVALEMTARLKRVQRNLAEATLDDLVVPYHALAVARAYLNEPDPTPVAGGDNPAARPTPP